MKKALILAAGEGKRLGNLTSEIPKCLLSINSKNTLIDFSLEAIKDTGIKEIIFVTGYKKEKLEEHVGKKWSKDFQFKFIFNDKFSDYNNIYSAYLAKDIWDDGTVLLNSDIIYDPKILKNLVNTVKLTRSKMSYLVIDNEKDLLDEDMKVIVSADDEIKEINKKLNIDDSYGEYIGITYLRGEERENFLKSLEKNITSKNLDLYYEDAIAHILEKSKVFPCSTGGMLWTEIDTKEDYEYAQKISREIRKEALL